MAVFTEEKTPPIITKLYKGTVEVKLFPDSHQYWVNGKRATGVTTFIGIKDKSRPLVIWATEIYRDFLLGAIKVAVITVEHIYRGAVLHEERKREAAETGNKIHDWCEQYIKSILDPKNVAIPDMPEEQAVKIGVAAFLDWVAEHKPKFKSSERLVYSKKHGYVGTLDIEAEIKGKLYLIDLKSSNGLYNTVNMQTAAYVKADEEESGRKYAGRWAIRISKESEEEYLVRMEKKQQNDILKGREPREIEPYQIFEAKPLETDIDGDFEAFLACKTLYEWDKKTDYYQAKKRV
jgi:hypothetical protein